MTDPAQVARKLVELAPMLAALQGELREAAEGLRRAQGSCEALAQAAGLLAAIAGELAASTREMTHASR